jgi:hypothetical protein
MALKPLSAVSVVQQVVAAISLLRLPLLLLLLLLQGQCARIRGDDPIGVRPRHSKFSYAAAEQQTQPCCIR